MQNVLSSSLLNLGLRIFSIIAKFLLVVGVGKFLGVKLLGEYSLFNTTITFVVYFLGFDFYVFNTREILAVNKCQRIIFLRDQLIFHFVIYLIILPLLIFIFIFHVIDYEYISYFYVILIFEHLSQELYRVFTTIQKPVFANFLLFLRMGAWIYPILLFWYFNLANNQNLDLIWLGWIVGLFISIILGIVKLKRDFDFSSLRGKSVNWNWIKNGIKTSIPFFIGTIAYKIIEFSDRYMIDFYLSKSEVGVYSFFSSVANVLNTVVFSTVVMVWYPRLVEKYQKNNFVSFCEEFQVFKKKTIFVILVGIMGAVFFIWPVLSFMDKNSITDEIKVYWVLLLGNVIFNFSLVFHYVLFSAKKDLVIRNSTLIGAIMNVILNFFLIKVGGILGAAIATLTSYGFILIIKLIESKKILSKLEK